MKALVSAYVDMELRIFAAAAVDCKCSCDYWLRLAIIIRNSIHASSNTVTVKYHNRERIEWIER